MVDAKSIVNLKIAASYNNIFSDGKVINDYLSNNCSLSLIKLLSIVSFREEERVKIQKWCLSKNIVPKDSAIEFRDTSIFSRRGRLTAWKHTIININNKIKGHDFDKNLARLCKVFLLINDLPEDHDDLHSIFVNGFLDNYRDNCLHQLNRSFLIILSSAKLGIYRDNFFKHYGVSVEQYVFVVHLAVCHYNNFDRINYFHHFDLDSWIFDSNNKLWIETVDLKILKKVMDIISFTIEEGIDFCQKTLSKPYDFTLFRNKPFIEISKGNFLPIDGKLVEDLLFNNLFHKLQNTPGNENFITHFGAGFEEYVNTLCHIASGINSKYLIIPEFSFKKGQNKSPDVMLLSQKDNTVLVIEVKSARFLDSIITSNNSNNDILKSFDKLKINPWKQSVNAISYIAHHKIHPDLTPDKTYMFLSVTMNDIPLSLYDHIILNGAESKDTSNAFFSMNIEAFELFIEIISSESDCDFIEILGNYNDLKRNMSLKTYLARIKRKFKIENKKFSDMIYQSQDSFVKRNLNKHTQSMRS